MLVAHVAEAETWGGITWRGWLSWNPRLHDRQAPALPLLPLASCADILTMGPFLSIAGTT